MHAPTELMAKVHAYTLTMPLERDPWQKGPAVTAMLRTGEAKVVDDARRILERAIATQTSAGHLNYDDIRYGTYGHVSSFTPTMKGASLGYPLLFLHEMEPNDLYLEAARKQAAMALATDRTKDGGISARAERVELWIDFVYLLAPFLLKLGTVLGDERMIEEAYRQLRVHIKHLVDPHAGLARHAWVETPNSFSQSTFWSRGNAWLGTGIVEIVSIAPDAPDVAGAADVLRTMMAAVVETQDASGYWREVLDDPTSPMESSGTLMHAYTIARGIELDLLPEEYLEHAVRGFEVVAGSVEDDGAVPAVSVPPGGPGVPFGSTAFGQGFFVQAGQVLTRIGAV